MSADPPDATDVADPALRPWMTVAREVHLRERLACCAKLPSAPGLRCADLLSRWLKGLHNLPGGVYSYDWSTGSVSLCIADSLSSTDDDALTTLVVLAHVLAIRVLVAPASPSRLRVSLYPRARAVPGGDPMREHPDLDAAVEPWRASGGNRVA